jgi:flagellar protein FliS
MTTDSKASETKAQAYLRTKVMSASPEELRLMLIDGAIRFTRQGRDAIERKDWEGVYEGFTKAKEILLELINALRPEVDPDLCSRLSALYTFMYRRLLDASLEKSAAIADEVIELLEYDRETWVMLMDKLAEERGRGAAPAAREYAGTPTGGFSVEG